MCGIAGIALGSAGSLPVRETVRQMCDQIIHRGPDDEGIFAGQGVAIGMRRLSIIDLAGGHQPIHNEDKTKWLVFNGEIYNYRELRVDLEKAGHRFYTSSDSEAIIHAYEEYGTECFSKLRGMFAIAIWDVVERRLVLARDRFGKKPLFYTQLADGSLAFGSELKCLVAVPGWGRDVSLDAIRQFLIMGYVSTPRSIFSAVAKLEPAHWLEWRDGAIRRQSFWKLPFAPKIVDTEAGLTERLSHEVEEPFA